MVDESTSESVAASVGASVGALVGFSVGSSHRDKRWGYDDTFEALIFLESKI